MLTNMYSVFDSVSEVYGPILLEVNNNTLKRSVKSMLMEEIKKGNVSMQGLYARRHDLDVYQVGTYDTATGIVSPVKEKVFAVFDLCEEVLDEINFEAAKLKIKKMNEERKEEINGHES